MGSAALASPTVRIADASGTAYEDGETLVFNYYQLPGSASLEGLFAQNRTVDDTEFSSRIVGTDGLGLGPISIATPLPSGVDVALPSPTATLDTESPSGVYEARLTLNDENPVPGFPSETSLTAEFRLYEAPNFIGPTVVDVSAGEGLSLTIEPAADGRLVAGVRRRGSTISSRFHTDFLPVLEEVQPGQTLTAPVEYTPYRYGRLTGVQIGLLRYSFELITESGGPLINAPSSIFDLDAVFVTHEYELRYAYDDTLFDAVSYAPQQTFRSQLIGVNTESVAATLIGGRSVLEQGSGVDQTFSMEVVGDPLFGLEGEYTLISDVVAVDPGAAGQIYAIQLNYDPAFFPFGTDPDTTTLLAFDESTQSWVPAVLLNSDSGAGAREGRISLGRTGLDADNLTADDLGYFGEFSSTSTSRPNVWAVLDFAGPLAVGVATPITGDIDGDGRVDDVELGIAISNFTGPVGSAGGKTLSQGDVDGDGDVDDTDLGVMISGFTGPLAPAAVPEPATGALALLGLAALSRRRRC